ncbi:MAG TPA: lytic transglycosylase domain-containing protein [Trebonia sp.]
MPVLAGCGLAAVSVIVGGCLVAVSGGPDSAARLGSGTSASASGTAGAGQDGTVSDRGATALSLPWSTASPAAGPGGAATASAPPAGTASQSAGGQDSGQGSDGTPKLVVPDVIASVPGGVTAADVTKIDKLSQVRDVATVAGARISVNGKQLTVLGATKSAIQTWMAPSTAVSQSVWSAFDSGDLVTTASARRGAGLTAGDVYPVTAAVRTSIRYGTSTLLGVAGVDGIVNEAQAGHLGLVRNAAVLISAPAASLLDLTSQVQQVLGSGSKVVRLVSVSTSTASLPVDDANVSTTGRPDSYIQLFQESAAKYCPGLSWTVLAAIGQIESADGTNEGPSSAGALGPMQFEPSTWTIWGITAFGETGAPNIMDPFDAVPSAARMLCADGAAGGGQQLRDAIFDYNHATWYVDEVLSLANEYASEFSS